MFITFEGLDFSGKTTQANLLIAKLKGLFRTRHEDRDAVTLIREPGGTRISERIRDILLDKKGLDVTDTTELFLFSASRSQLVGEVIAPSLRRGEIVICDRYHDSTTAYQGYGRGIDLEAIRTINRIATCGIDPDLTLLVDITIDEITRRKSLAGVPFDRMESLGPEFYERVRNGYIEMAEREPNRFFRVNGMVPVPSVEREIWKAVEERLVTHKQLV